jgi:hypothetical protein
MVAAGIAAAAMSRMNWWDLELQEKNGDLYRLRVTGTPPEQALLRLQARMGGAK